MSDLVFFHRKINDRTPGRPLCVEALRRNRPLRPSAAAPQTRCRPAPWPELCRSSMAKSPLDGGNAPSAVPLKIQKLPPSKWPLFTTNDLYKKWEEWVFSVFDETQRMTWSVLPSGTSYQNILTFQLLQIGTSMGKIIHYHNSDQSCKEGNKWRFPTVMGVYKVMVVPPNGWFRMDNPKQKCYLFPETSIRKLYLTSSLKPLWVYQPRVLPSVIVFLVFVSLVSPNSVGVSNLNGL